VFHFGRGVAYAAKGNVAEAEKASTAYTAARKTVPGDADWGYNKAGDVLAIADAVLAGWIARAKHDDASAIKAFRDAVLAEDMLKYDEPTDWFYPTRESLGASLLRAKRLEDGARVFPDDLTHDPPDSRPLFGLSHTPLAV